ncbi:uncharacterized protein LOC112351503 [Selaginella moellendorffii]|uniref:uncharacterized protein LOC112351503 n=1 Tax=Selaginella moellendorffii TaxID=88036 RepID=UPI000D1CC227|nr:uncharacterized protein LOC112351503 [Selaginella moellendorffii]|eukprot:XP_024545268.1 uncharacterized protein LOC112351503 [Selaginella moellendorffii]
MFRGGPMWILLDSGSDDNFVSAKFVAEHSLVTCGVPPYTVEGAATSAQHINACVEGLKVLVDKTTLVEIFYLADIHRMDLILGMSWLVKVDPEIKWSINRVLLEYGGVKDVWFEEGVQPLIVTLSTTSLK